MPVWYAHDTHMIRIWYASDTHLIRIWYSSDTHLILIWYSSDTQIEYPIPILVSDEYQTDTHDTRLILTEQFADDSIRWCSAAHSAELYLLMQINVPTAMLQTNYWTGSMVRQTEASPQNEQSHFCLSGSGSSRASLGWSNTQEEIGTFEFLGSRAFLM